jgi:GTPase SAR1 family protein
VSAHEGVVVVGPPGMGKSTLAFDWVKKMFPESAAAQKAVCLVGKASSSNAITPFYAFRAIIERVLWMSSDASDSASAQKMQSAMMAAGTVLDLVDVLPRAASMLLSRQCVTSALMDSSTKRRPR